MLTRVSSPDPLIPTAEARLYLRVDHEEEDALIDSLCAAATEHAETYLRRALLTQRWKYTADRFPGDGACIELPRPPLQSVEEIRYRSTSGDAVTLDAADYEVITEGEPGRVRIKSGHWPAGDDVVIEFTAGHASAADVPETYRTAARFLLGHWYEHRESVALGTIASEVPQTADFLLRPHRFLRFA